MQRGLTRWTPGFPWRDFGKFFEEDWEGADFIPAIDVRQEKDDVVVETSLPGIDPDKVDILVENDVLTISGHTEEKKEVKWEDYYRKEIREGSFSRSVILPMGVMLGTVEKTPEAAVIEMALGVKAYIEEYPDCPIEEITFVVFNDIKLQSLLSATPDGYIK